jgi:putative endopeptidase
MFRIAGIENAVAAANTTLAIETQLAEHNWTPVGKRDNEKRYNKYRAKKLKNLAKKFDWDIYLKALGVEAQSQIIINQPGYVEGFGKVFAARSLADWKIYLRFYTISNFSTYLTDALDTKDFDFYARQLSGRNEARPRWKRAVAVVNENLGEAYVARHFTTQAKTCVSMMVQNLSNAYAQSIQGLDWMTPASKKAALIKLDAFTSKIGYPDKWEDYSELMVDPKDLVGNIMRSRTIAANKEVAKLGGPIRT